MEFKSDFIAIRCADYIKLKPCNAGDMVLFDKLLASGCDHFKGTFGTPKKEKTYKQLATVWKLVDIIFKSMEGRKPTSQEARELYEDLLEEYAERRPSSVSGKLVPVHVSEADTKACAYFIEGLMLHLAQFCDLPMDAQTEVRELFFLQEYYTGKFGADWITQCSEAEYRERHPMSEASGVGGALHLHHLVTRASCEALKNVTANWCMLLPSEHELIHKNEKKFFELYPHLKPKWERAHMLKADVYKGGIGNGRTMV